MFCPKCKAEYRPGFYRCIDCDIDLVDMLPFEPDKSPVPILNPMPDDVGNPELKTVVVFETGDLTLMAIAKSILDDAGIMHYEDEFAVNNFGLGAPFGTYSTFFGPAKIYVREDEAEVAIELLRELKEQ